MLPFSADADSLASVDGHEMHWGRGTGMFLPQTDTRVIGRGGFRCHIMWQLEKDRLQAWVEELIYRQSVMLLRPDFFLTEPGPELPSEAGHQSQSPRGTPAINCFGVHQFHANPTRPVGQRQTRR